MPNADAANTVDATCTKTVPGCLPIGTASNGTCVDIELEID